jgi:hypothetical protein
MSYAIKEHKMISDALLGNKTVISRNKEGRSFRVHSIKETSSGESRLKMSHHPDDALGARSVMVHDGDFEFEIV